MRLTPIWQCYYSSFSDCIAFNQMDAQLQSALRNVADPALTIGVILLAMRLRAARLHRTGWRNDLGLVWPKWPQFLLWLGIGIGWIIVGDIASHLLGMEQPKPWHYPPLIVALRILAIGLLGPIMEEILFRGMIFHFVGRTRLGAWGAIFFCAATWAAMHYRYEWMVMALIFCDGIVLGLARYRTRSVIVPMVLHSLNNLYSIYQSIHR